MSKKTFYIILLIILGLIIIGGLIWYFTLKSEKITMPESDVNFTVPDQIANKTDVKVISEEPVTSLYRNNGNVLFYGFSGKLWKINENELKPVLLDEKPIENLSEIIWPKTVSPDGKKIVYQKNNGLFTSDLNGKNQRTLMSDLKLKDVIVKWPNTNNIALISKPSGLAAGGLWFLDIRNSNIKKIISNFFGLEVLLSPDGNSFIYSYVDQSGKDLRLAVYDKKGNQRIINNVSTLIDKCVWSKDSINVYCAVPKSWSDFAVLPDDYYKNAFSTSDDIWKINTETGEKTFVLKYIGGISNMIVTNDEKNIFFISKENQFLYKLNIK